MMECTPESGRCHSVYTLLWCTLQQRGQIYSPYIYCTPICTLWCPALQFLIVHMSYILKKLCFLTVWVLLHVLFSYVKHILRLQKYSGRKIPETVLHTVHCPDTATARNFNFKYKIFCNTVLDKKERTVTDRNYTK